MSRWECEPQRLVLHITEVLKEGIYYGDRKQGDGNRNGTGGRNGMAMVVGIGQTEFLMTSTSFSMAMTPTAAGLGWFERRG